MKCPECGKEITSVVVDMESFRASLDNVDEDGRVIIETANSSVDAICCGECEHVFEDDELEIVVVGMD